MEDEEGTGQISFLSVTTRMCDDLKQSVGAECILRANSVRAQVLRLRGGILPVCLTRSGLSSPGVT